MSYDDVDEYNEDDQRHGMPYQKGFVFYGSSKITQNTKGVFITTTTSVSYAPDDNEPPRVSLEKWQQAHDELGRRVYTNALSRKIALQSGTTISDQQFENDYLDDQGESNETR